MSTAGPQLAVYLQLARAATVRQEHLDRDKLLVLAAVTAAESGWTALAERCRERVLAENPRHLLRRWPTVDEALEDDEFLAYVKQLRRRYSPERAEHLADELGLYVAAQGARYDDPREFAAAILTELDAGTPLPVDLGRGPAARQGLARRTATPWPGARPTFLGWWATLLVLGLLGAIVVLGVALALRGR